MAWVSKWYHTDSLFDCQNKGCVAWLGLGGGRGRRLTNPAAAVRYKEIITMKPKPVKPGGDNPLVSLTDAERAALRYRSKLIEMLDGVRRSVCEAPAEMDIPRTSIEGLLMAAFYLLDVHDGLLEMDDAYFIKSAIRELQQALGLLGLGVDYWEKINAWRERDLKEEGEMDFLMVD